MTDLERIVAQLDLAPPYAPRTVDGWPGVSVEVRTSWVKWPGKPEEPPGSIWVHAPSNLALTALDAWYSAVVDGKPSDSELDWEACRDAVRGELITIEQLAILLRLAGPKSSPQSSSPAGPTG